MKIENLNNIIKKMTELNPFECEIESPTATPEYASDQNNICNICSKAELVRIIQSPSKHYLCLYCDDHRVNVTYNSYKNENKCSVKNCPNVGSVGYVKKIFVCYNCLPEEGANICDVEMIRAWESGQHGWIRVNINTPIINILTSLQCRKILNKSQIFFEMLPSTIKSVQLKYRDIDVMISDKKIRISDYIKPTHKYETVQMIMHKC